MSYTYIKTHNLLEFYAVKNGLEERGLVYMGGSPERGRNIIKIDPIGVFGLCTHLEWIIQTNEEETSINA